MATIYATGYNDLKHDLVKKGDVVLYKDEPIIEVVRDWGKGYRRYTNIYRFNDKGLYQYPSDTLIRYDTIVAVETL